MVQFCKYSQSDHSRFHRFLYLVCCIGFTLLWLSKTYIPQHCPLSKCRQFAYFAVSLAMDRDWCAGRQACCSCSLLSAQGSILVTPFNSFLYNMQYDNLALHGIHSRLTHLLVNMPMLYNVGFVCLLFSSIGSIKRKLWTLSTQAGSGMTYYMIYQV